MKRFLRWVSLPAPDGGLQLWVPSAVLLTSSSWSNPWGQILGGIDWHVSILVRQDRVRTCLRLMNSGLLLRAVSLYPVDVSELDLNALMEVASVTWDAIKPLRCPLGQAEVTVPVGDTLPSWNSSQDIVVYLQWFWAWGIQILSSTWKEYRKAEEWLS